MKIERPAILFLGFFGLFAALAATGMKTQSEGMNMDNKNKQGNIQVATFAGGCFWCIEADFEKSEGVVDAVSGYTGGNSGYPTYEAVCSGTTGHVEAVRVWFDADRLPYEKLLDIFWDHIDPTDDGGQFVDRGPQYATAIFYHDENQKRIAEASKNALSASGLYGKPIVTAIREVGQFYDAEAYHQDFYKKCPVRYNAYRRHSARDDFLKVMRMNKNVTKTDATSKKYAKPTDDELKKRLTPIQYRVTRENATEPPFENEFWNNKHEGIYVDVVSGEPLFSSADKFDSGTGWPSFTRPLVPENIVKRKDTGMFMLRTEVRSKIGDSHLGHVFSDGPEPTGLRYCINSGALQFIPKEDLEELGYGKYLEHFKQD